MLKMNIALKQKKVVFFMVNAKIKIRIVGIILLVIGLFTIINFSYMTYVNWVYTGLMHLGDIILGVNKQPVTTIESLNNSLRGRNKKILLRINRKGRLFYLVIR